MTMTSSRPYMIRALYEWIVDNDCVPYLLVDAHGTGVEVPQQYVNKDGQIVLNISPGAVADLQMNNEAISFSARFGGISTNIFVTISAVLGIYARETGQGMIFEQENQPEEPPPDNSGGDGNISAKEGKKPSLRVVK